MGGARRSGAVLSLGGGRLAALAIGHRRRARHDVSRRLDAGPTRGAACAVRHRFL